MHLIEYKMPKHTPQVWALSFTAKVCSVRNDIEWTEAYKLAFGYAEALPNLLYEDPCEVALIYLEGQWF